MEVEVLVADQAEALAEAVLVEASVAEALAEVVLAEDGKLFHLKSLNCLTIKDMVRMGASKIKTFDP